MNSLEEIKNKIENTDGRFVQISIGAHLFKVYIASLRDKDDNTFFIAKMNHKKVLVILTRDRNLTFELFEGVDENIEGRFFIKISGLNHRNALCTMDVFTFARPVLLGVCNSFGFGDRLGIANPGHLLSLPGSKFKPVLAQQSIRELSRTNRKPENVMDAAVWAVLQEGYEDGFGADADHLKTTGDIDLMMDAGYTMFTFDPSDYVENIADSMDAFTLNEKLNEIKWQDFSADRRYLFNEYIGKTFQISDDFSITPSEDEVLRAAVKYANAVSHVKYLYYHLTKNYSGRPFEVEISVDETDSTTTPFEHFFVAKELNRLNVEIVSLAPRFIGDFEKGIDYKGDINLFKREYHKHLQITKFFGSYKLSIHSGSDKFKAYAVIGTFNDAFTHVKTAGTSYLEALRVVAAKEPGLFRNILDYSRSLYINEKKTYHVSAEIEKTKPAEEYSDAELTDLLNDDNARQILHVAYGRILTDKNEFGDYLFKDALFECLAENEELYDEYLKRHFIKHLSPFEKNKVEQGNINEK